MGCHYLELQFELWFVLQIKTSQDQDFLKIREDILYPNFTFVLLPAVRLPISAEIVECLQNIKRSIPKQSPPFLMGNPELRSQRDRAFGLPPSFESLNEDPDDLEIRVQRDRALGLPPSFESLNEDGGDLFGRCSREATPVPLFENFADEETWATLNHGHGHDADEFLSANFSYGRQTSGVSEESNRSNVVCEKILSW